MTTETLGERLNSTLSWENVLLAWADQRADEHDTVSGIEASAAELDAAYRACAAVTAEHSRTFSMASALLPAPKRRAVRALYAFCRRTDDLVDRAQGDAQTALENWRIQSLSPHPRRDDPVALAWADTRVIASRRGMSSSYSRGCDGTCARTATQSSTNRPDMRTGLPRRWD